MCVQFHQQSQSKLLGHLLVFLPSQCWCARFGELTAINNIIRENKEIGQKWKKKQRWVEVSQPFLSETVAIITAHFNIMSNCKTVKLKKNVLKMFCVSWRSPYKSADELWVSPDKLWNGYETRLTPLLYVFVSFYGPDCAQHSIVFL